MLFIFHQYNILMPDMNGSTIAMAVAVLVVLVLLKKCVDDKSYGSQSGQSRRSGRVGRGRVGRMRRATEAMGLDEDAISEYGTGKRNRRLASQYNDLIDDGAYGDYGSAMKRMSLEPEVFDSHSSWSNDIGIANRGASTLAIRSDPNDAVPWIGLRRPDYHSVYAMPDARVDHSEFPDQMPARTQFLL